MSGKTETTDERGNMGRSLEETISTLQSKLFELSQKVDALESELHSKVGKDETPWPNGVHPESKQGAGIRDRLIEQFLDDSEEMESRKNKEEK